MTAIKWIFLALLFFLVIGLLFNAVSYLLMFVFDGLLWLFYNPVDAIVLIFIIGTIVIASNKLIKK